MGTYQEEYKKHILLLIEKLASGCADPDEIREIDEWYDNAVSEERYAEGMSDEEKSLARDRLLLCINAKILQQTVPVQKNISRKLIKVIAIAAVMLAVFSGVITYYLKTGKKSSNPANYANNFKPGKDNAILTLSNGEKIILTGLKNGKLTTQGHIVIEKTANGQVVYRPDESKTSEMVYNMMSTPPGGQYRLTMSDGTNVWLNAASSIKYPTVFNGKDRLVEITGEAYFEVSHISDHPFKVITKGQTVEVLGTHFNINAYNNEKNIKTTLLQGSIRLTEGKESRILRPGQQAAVNLSGITLQNVDAEEEVAWKNGYFDFSDADIATVMRQLSRWYNVEILFEGPISTETFTGRIPRSWNLIQVIDILQASNNPIHITVQGRRIMVKQ